MAAVVPDPDAIHAFATQAAFEVWLSRNHAKKSELWLKLHKKGSGLPSITYAEAIDVVLCWGWIDGIRKAFDEASFLQRFSPRRPKSIWSQVNRDHVARLITAGHMTEHGLRHVEAAQADGRWAAAYAPARSMTLPEDLQAAIAGSAAATATLATLDKTNLFALAFRVGNVKTPARRAAKVATYVAMLARGESLLPRVKAPRQSAPPVLSPPSP